MFKKCVFILIVLLGLLIYSSESYGITIGPSRFEVSLPPGEIAVTDYYVQNETDMPIHVRVEPENWFKDAYSYKSLPIKDWLEFDIYEFSLQPKEIKKLKATIKVPTGIKGEVVAQIFFTSAVPRESGELTGIEARIGAVLYVAIKGTEIVDAEIENISISKVKEIGKEKLKIGVMVKNKGNVHIRPTGKILIESQKGQKIAELDLLSGRATLPKKDFVYYAYWDEPELKKGEYKVSTAINYGEIFDIKKSATFEKSFGVNKNGEVVLK